jgi:hypothetical protein
VPKPTVLAPGLVKVIKQGSVDKNSDRYFLQKSWKIVKSESRNSEILKRMRIIHSTAD